MNTGPHNLTVFWSTVNNTWGNILRYIVRFDRKKNTTTSKRQIVDFHYNSTTLHNLTRDTQYRIKVKAVTSGGHGPFSQYIPCRTLAEGKCMVPFDSEEL